MSEPTGPADVGLRGRIAAAAESLSLPGFAETVRGVVTSVRQSLDEHRPDSLSVEFGIEIAARAGGLLSVLAEVGATAQVRVTASWDRPECRPSTVPPGGIGAAMKREDAAKDLLATCSARLDTDEGPQGTAFFVAPGYAVTAAHVVSGADGLPVLLSEGPDRWSGHVADVRPPLAGEIASESPYPAPDIALIKIDDGPEHACALLGRQFPDTGVWVMARGHTRTFDQQAVTAETESFRLTGTLETPDPGCTLLKLGLGEVTQGMSGAPVLELGTGNVIGMLRTSRKLGSNLGGWVVPAGLIRLLWPDEAGLGNDRFHERDSRWRQGASQLRALSSQGTPTEGGLSIGKIEGDVGAVITGGNVGTVNIELRPGATAATADREDAMADDDTDTGSEDQQTTGAGEDSKPESKEDGKPEGKGKDDKKPSDKSDDGPERKDQFAEATGDPLADALGGPSSRAGEAQAYRSWMRTVHASGAGSIRGRRAYRRP